MKYLIDLHVHSSASDGTLSPEALVKLAAKRNLRAFALTDHDTISGVQTAQTIGEQYGVEVISGIELSVYYKDIEIHLVGLGFDINNAALLEQLTTFQQSRQQRNLEIIKKLQGVTIDISYEQMLAEFGDTIWTRAHFASFLRYHKYVSNMADAFTKYIGDTAPCYVPRSKVNIVDAIQLIHNAGGYAILAHPLLYQLSNKDLEHMLKDLAQWHLDGIEVFYSSNRQGDEGYLKKVANQYGLKYSGGSDFHGNNKPNIHLGVGKGNVSIPYTVWEQIQS